MEKFVPYEKLSKKEKKKRDAMARSTWGNLKPVTRKPENSRAYNRRKAQKWDQSHSVPFFAISNWRQVTKRAGPKPSSADEEGR